MPTVTPDTTDHVPSVVTPNPYGPIFPVTTNSESKVISKATAGTEQALNEEEFSIDFPTEEASATPIEDKEEELKAEDLKN